MLGARRVERLLVCGGWALPAVKAVCFCLKSEPQTHKLYSEFSRSFLPGLRHANGSVTFKLFEGAPHNSVLLELSEGPPVVLNLDLYRQPHQLVQRMLDLQAIARGAD